MSVDAKSSINSLSLQFMINGGGDGIALKKTTEDVVVNGFLPALEQLVDKYSPEEAVISIDSIVCDIDVKDDKIDKALADKIIRQLETQLAEKVNAFYQENKALPLKMRQADLLLFYLRNGFMPWFSNIGSRTQLNELIATLIEQGMTEESTGALIQLLRLDTVILRICNDFDEQVFWALIALFTGSRDKQILDGWRDDYHSLASYAGVTIKSSIIAHAYITQAYKKSLLKSIAAYGVAASAQSLAVMNRFFAKLFVTELASEIKSPEIVEQLMVTGSTPGLRNDVLAKQLRNVGSANKPKPENEAKPDIEMETKPDEIPKKPAKEPIYINNSGLVIVAPYLTMFFKRVDVVVDNKIVNPSKGIALLHYMATGIETFAEFEVVLPKLLCGFAPDFAIPAPYQITPTDVELVDELLKAVISNWAILKNTSVAGLREAFLLREGKLTFMAEGSRLKVQRTSIDVLLEQVPWNISMIKLPWMTNLLTVDWI